MLTSVKSLYGRLSAMFALLCWAVLGTYFVFSFVLFLLPASIRLVGSVAVVIAALVGATWLWWPKLSHLRDAATVNSNKATIGIFLVSVALIAFPGTLVIPAVAAAWTGKKELSMLAYFAMVGLPIFAVVSLVGLVLVFASRPRGDA